MIYIITGLIGAALGVRQARKRKGNRLDQLHYAAGYGIFFTLLGLVATIILDRTVL